MEDFDSSSLPTTFDRHLQTAIRPDVPLMVFDKLTGVERGDVDPDIAATADSLLRCVPLRHRGTETIGPIVLWQDVGAWYSQ